MIVLLMVMAAIGCKGNKVGIDKGGKSEDVETVTAEGPVEGGQIILPLTNFKTINPLITENQSYYYFSKLIFESLFEFDDDLNVIVQLAESYNIKDNGRTIEVKLRDDVLWHDGEQLKAEDVAFTVDTIKHGSSDNSYNEMFSDALGSYRPNDIRRIIDINILDDRNLVINFSREFSNNLEVLTFPIIPKHIFAQNSGSRNAFIEALSIDQDKVVGTGPFKFESYESMKQITLKSNELYREGKPYIDEIVGRVIGTEEDILTSFETGQINIATTVGADWDKYNQNDRINILEFISPNYEFLGFNFSKKTFAEEEGQGLRRAIAYGLNRQNIIETVYLGHGTQTDVPIHPDSWLTSEESNSYGYNLEAAKAELKKLGWKDNDGDGILEDSSGENISLNLLTNSYNLTRLKMAEMIKEDLQRLGIGVNIIVEDMKDSITKEDIESQWIEVNEQVSRGNYDIVLLGWQLSVIPDLSFAFHSSQIPYNTNIIKYSNEEMDRILEEAFLVGTREGKLESYKELQKFIVTDLPYVSLFFKNKALLVDNKIIGELSPIFINPYRGIEKCYIPEELQ